jgi:ATP-dependent Clp protease ATP-binding subunit ClpA
LVHSGFDPTYGARPLKRAIQKQIETRLGRMIIKGEIHDHDDVLVDYDPSAEDLVFTISPSISQATAA